MASSYIADEPSIVRWTDVNQLRPTSEVVVLRRQISSELFFMAIRSQEPVTYNMNSDASLSLTP
jgi:hypothetical protein